MQIYRKYYQSSAFIIQLMIITYYHNCACLLDTNFNNGNVI